MFKKYAYKILLLFMILVAVPLHAAQHHQKNASNSQVAPDALIKEKEYYEKVRKIEEKRYGATHIITAKTMHNLGYVLNNLGSYTSAKNYLETYCYP